jgi:hypothetical protein
MKKLLLSFLLVTICLLIAKNNCNAQIVNIPDSAFKYVLLNLTSVNTNVDDEIQVSEAINFSGTLDVSGSGISDLTGIDAFTNITGLNCCCNYLQNLDVSNNLSLSYLNCSSNQLNSLTTGSIPLLNLNCSINQIINLDITGNTALTRLECLQNQLSNLNHDNNVNLNYLDCANNQFQSLDFSFNPNLKTLIAYGNPLTSINVSQNTELELLSCSWTQLASVDISNCTALKRLDLYLVPLTSIDLTNNAELVYLECAHNQLSTINVSQNPALEFISCSYNQLTGLDVSQNPMLEKLYCPNNQISTLDLSQNTALTDLDISFNQFSGIDLSSNSALSLLSCINNQLTDLDLSQNIAFTALAAWDNQLVSLNVKNGNNINYFLGTFGAYNNPNLYCVEVDDAEWATEHWWGPEGAFDTIVTFSEDCSVGVHDIVNSSGLIIYPNPATSNLNLTSYLINETTTISIFNSLGQQVFVPLLQQEENRVTLYTTHLAAGVYSLVLNNSSQQVSKRFLKE